MRRVAVLLAANAEQSPIRSDGYHAQSPLPTSPVNDRSVIQLLREADVVA